jgi:hypothetical protein
MFEQRLLRIHQYRQSCGLLLWCKTQTSCALLDLVPTEYLYKQWTFRLLIILLINRRS